MKEYDCTIADICRRTMAYRLSARRWLPVIRGDKMKQLNRIVMYTDRGDRSSNPLIPVSERRPKPLRGNSSQLMNRSLGVHDLPMHRNIIDGRKPGMRERVVYQFVARAVRRAN